MRRLRLLFFLIGNLTSKSRKTKTVEKLTTRSTTQLFLDIEGVTIKNSAPYHEQGIERSMLDTNSTPEVPAFQGAVDNIGLPVAQLREQQDQENERSLETDRLLTQCRTQTQRRQRVQLRREEQQLAEMNQLRCRRRNCLPPEPNDGIMLKLRSGECRKFRVTDDIKVLFNFIGSLPNATKEFSITSCGGPKINSWTDGTTIGEAGIVCPCVLEVQWNVERPDNDNNSYEELMQSLYQEEDLYIEDEPTSSNEQVSDEPSAVSSLREILLQWRLSTLTSGEQHIRVTRMPIALFQHAMRCYDRKQFDLKKRIDETEEGYDINKDMMALVEGKFHIVGKMVASILLHGGSVTPIFSHWMIQYAKIGMEVATNKDTVRNTEKKKFIEKLQLENAENLSDDNQVLDILDEAGIYMKLTENNKPSIIKAVTAFYSEITDKQAMLDQFWEGAETLGMKSLLISYPEVESIICKQCGVQEVITADKFMQMVTIDQHGEPASNMRNRSEEISQNFESFIYDVEDGKCRCNDKVLNLGDVIKFFTGTSTIPPGGFDSNFMIHFTADNCYPYVSTCSLDVTLPLKYYNYNTFKEVLIESIIGGPGFGRV